MTPPYDTTLSRYTVVNLKVSFEINLSTVTLVRRVFFILKTVWTDTIENGEIHICVYGKVNFPEF